MGALAARRLSRYLFGRMNTLGRFWSYNGVELMHRVDKRVVGYLSLYFFLVPEKLIVRVTARQCAFAGFVADAKAVK